MNFQFFHGGSITSKAGGYEVSRNATKRTKLGTGLYLTNDYDRAALYSKSIKVINIVLDPKTSMKAVSIQYCTALEYLKDNHSKALVKTFTERFEKFKDGSLISLEQFEIFVLNNTARINKKQLQALNDFFISVGCTYSVHVDKGYTLRVLDFRIINSIEKFDNKKHSFESNFDEDDFIIYG